MPKSKSELPREIRSKLLEFEESSPNRRRATPENNYNNSGRPTVWEIPEFQYDALPVGRQRIRLLRLLPGVLDSPQIDCEMFEAEFNEDRLLVRISDDPPAPDKTVRKIYEQKSDTKGHDARQESRKNEGQANNDTQSSGENSHKNQGQVNGDTQSSGKSSHKSEEEKVNDDTKSPEDSSHKDEGQSGQASIPQGDTEEEKLKKEKAERKEKQKAKRKRKREERRRRRKARKDMIEYEALSWRWGG